MKKKTKLPAQYFTTVQGWNTKQREVQTCTECTCLWTKQQVKTKTVEITPWNNEPSCCHV